MEDDAKNPTEPPSEHTRYGSCITREPSIAKAAPETHQDTIHNLHIEKEDDTFNGLPRPELAECNFSNLDSRYQPTAFRNFLSDVDPSTADITANSPKYRRQYSTYTDGIHDLRNDKNHFMAPAQLYSTLSGRLFHSGRIVIVLVGLPARGKTHISVSLSRYLQWLGVKTRVFHLADYRRATIGDNKDMPDDYFFVNASATSVYLRQKILRKCRDDLYAWLDRENGQVAIYDAVNPHAVGRRALAMEFARRNVQTLFLESYVTDQKILAENARNVKIHSPDFQGMDPDEAAQLYLKRIDMKIPHFETMTENDLNYIKMINAGEGIQYNNVSFGYLSYRIVFYLINLHIKFRVTYFAREGTSSDDDSYKLDASLSEEGVHYSRKMTKTLIAYRKTVRDTAIAQGQSLATSRPLTVWTSTRKLTFETAIPLKEEGYTVRQRPQMSQLNPGICEHLNEASILQQYPDEVVRRKADPYHHRYPRAESYHDLAVRLEPIIMELEREENDLLIIAHESVLRVLYGYLMACDARHIPNLDFPRHQIFEIIPASYQNEAKVIPINYFVPGSSHEPLSNTNSPSTTCEQWSSPSSARIPPHSSTLGPKEHPLSLD